MAETLFLVLGKVALSLGQVASDKLSTGAAEAASVLTDFEHGMKLIEGEFMVLQAFIGQVSAQNVGDRTFHAWLDQVRDVAHQVEDIIDEYTLLTSQAAGIGNFFKRKFHQAKSFAAWQSLSRQIDQVETRIQRLSAMKDRYSISVGEPGRSSTLQYARQRQLSLSDSAYLTDDTELVGNASEIGRMTQWLLAERQERSVMSVLGMGGLGKTTIASSVYKRQRACGMFDSYAWVTLSQSYEVEEVLRQIMKQLMDQRAYKARGIGTLSRVRLVEELERYLQDRRYLIVLDDVWDKDDWLFLNCALAKNNLGSRVLITTRKRDVASLADGECVVELETLPCTEAWLLFCKKAFRILEDNTCPAKLRPLAEKILYRCQGLPLAIVTIGSLLSYRELEEQEWSCFHNQLSWQLANNPELSWILNLSLNDLSSYLKNCFLYCSLFPEDYKIKRSWISRFWVAEGFVEERGAGTTMEEVAECYLKELTQRSLLQVVERNVHGRARSFQMHDLVREVSLTVSEREKFAAVYGQSSDATQVGSAARRLCVHKDAQSLKVAAVSRIRSFILFDTQVPSSWINDISSNFRLIRVLSLRFAHIEHVPGVVSDFLNLHYLDLSYTKVKHIPASFGKLKNLQVLDLRFSYVEQLPWEITLLTKLRHLYVYMLRDFQERMFDCISATNVSGSISHLKNLQSLRSVSANKDLVTQLRNLTMLRSLAIMKMQQSYIAELWDSLVEMPRLSKLVIFASSKDDILDLRMLKPLRNLKSFWLRGRLCEGVLPQMFPSFEKLTRVKMDCCGLTRDPISSFAHMVNLVDLNLYRAYDGKQLTFHAGWFPKLNTLELGDMEHLEWIDIEDGTLKVLHNLHLVGLRNVKAVPQGIKYIKTLQKMFLTDMSKDLVDRLQGDDCDIVQHIPNIRSFDSSNPQAVHNLVLLPRLAKKYGSAATHWWELLARKA